MTVAICCTLIIIRYAIRIIANQNNYTVVLENDNYNASGDHIALYFCRTITCIISIDITAFNLGNKAYSFQSIKLDQRL